MQHSALPARPPFTIRARLLTPLQSGGTRHESDARVEVDATGRLVAVEPWTDAPDAASVIDLRPWVVMPGMVDMHLHLPQIPNAGLGAGLDLLTWLDRYIFPIERDYDRATAEDAGAEGAPGVGGGRDDDDGRVRRPLAGERRRVFRGRRGRTASVR